MNDIGVVVLNYNNYSLTKECVDNLIAINAPVDILIVDNSSTNDSVSILNSHYENKPIKIIKTNRNGGYAYGNNFGARFFEKDENIEYICIINPDVIITYPDLFTNLKNILKNNSEIGVITAKMLLRGEERVQNMFWHLPVGLEVATEAFELSSRKPNIITETDFQIVDVVPGSFFMIKKDALKQIGYLDENTFLYEEENILAIKLRNIGLREAISLQDSYIHNHKKQKQNLISKLKKRTIGFNSRRYMCSHYYGLKERVLLEIVIFLNYPLIICKYFKNKVKNCL